MLFKLALRNILRNKRRSLFTGLSMLVGYMLLVISLSIQDGTYHWVLKNYTKGQTGHIQLLHVDFLDQPSLYNTLDESSQLIDKISGFPWVESVTERIEAAALAYGENQGSTVALLGINPKKENNLRNLEGRVSLGRYLHQGPSDALIGSRVSDQLHLTIGDSIVLISQAVDGSMANALFNVVGVISDKDEHMSNSVLMRIEDLQSFLYMGNKAHRILINIKDYRDSEKYVAILNNWLNETYPQSKVRAFSWQQVEKEFYRTMSVDKEGNQLGMYIIVFLVCLGVLNTILMSLLERKGEYGVLKAVGVNKLHLFSTIIAEAQLLCFICCLLGFILVFPINFYFYSQGIPLEQPMDLSGINIDALRGVLTINVFLQPLFLLMVSTLLLTIIPAWRAASIRPLDGMNAL